MTKIKEKPSFYVLYGLGLLMVLLSIFFKDHGTPLFIIGVLAFLAALSETFAWSEHKRKRKLKVKKIKR